MAESQGQDYLKDNVPRIHKLIRVYLFLSMFSWSVTSLEDYAGGGGLTPDKLFLRILPLVLAVAYCFLGPLKKNLYGLKRPIFWPVWIYLAFGILCGLRSAALFLPMWKGFEIFASVVWVAATCPDEKHLKREFVATTFLIEVLMYIELLLAIINPDRGFWKSHTVLPWIAGYIPVINPNAMGFLTLIVLLRHLFLPSRYKVLRMMLTGAIFLCAQSRTSYATFAAALVVCVFDGLRQRKLGRVLIASGGAAAAAILALGYFDAIKAVVQRGETAEEISSLSGRTDYWNAALEHADWLGGGLAVGARSLIYVAADTFHKGMVSLHNSYLEVILDAGYIGGACYIVAIVGNILRIGFRSLRQPSEFNVVFLACSIMFATRGMTSVVLAIYSTDFFMMLLFWMYLSVSSDRKNVSLPKPVPRVRLEVNMKTAVQTQEQCSTPQTVG